ncbi:MAG: hypothetical protein ACREH9_06220, partial [Pseudomonadota bacterium]
MISLPNFKKRQSGSEMERSSLETKYNPTYDGATLAAFVTRAETAVERLRSLASVAERAAELGAMEDRIAGLERSLQSVERVAAQVSSIEAHASDIETAQQRTTEQLEETNAELARTREASAELLAKIDDTNGMREHLDRFLALEPQFST